MGFIIGDLFFLSPSPSPSLPDPSVARKDREIVSRDLFLVKLEQKSPIHLARLPTSLVLSGNSLSLNARTFCIIRLHRIVLR